MPVAAGDARAVGAAGELGAADVATKVDAPDGIDVDQGASGALLDIVTGDSGIVIGTHALIQDNVEFFDLGFVVVDEQHRFGVEQRDELRKRAKEGLSPQLLVRPRRRFPARSR